MTSLEIPKPNRREFLYYLGGASLALLGAGSVGLLSQFWNPPLRGEKDGIFQLSHEQIDVIKTMPIYLRESGVFVSWVNSGLIALDAHCTRHMWWVKWVPAENRFICPACGSKYDKDGTYIRGSAKRGLDRFTIEVTTPNGNITTPPDGSPVSIEGATQIVVDTNRVIYGQRRA